MPVVKIFKREIGFCKRKMQPCATNKFLFADAVVIILAFLSLKLFRPDYVVIIIYFLTTPYLILTERKSLIYSLTIASVVSLTWMLIARNEYGYNSNFLIILDINLFPLFAWALGLFALYIIYSHCEPILKEQGFMKKFLLFIAIYWLMLIAIEAIGYRFFNIHNLSAAGYQGLPIFGCIHAPRWMQVAYFSMGPVFFVTCRVLSFWDSKQFLNNL
ncbi:MAG TPA: hypothetical protein ENN38_07760 [Actinobacteria bacterium]|nr:hypothetical protein [Actinomycetota bacterium]